MSFINRIFWWRRISELENLVEKQHEIIKELGERAKEAAISGRDREETEKLKNDIKQISSALEKEMERASSLAREIRNEERINSELKEEIERKTALINEYEESIRTIKGQLEEVNDRYQELIEKFEKEKQTAICLEMLILDLDKELGLMDIAKKIEVVEKAPEITIKSR